MIPIQPSSSSHVSVRSLTIVVADDTIDVQEDIRRWLVELGHSVTCVSCGNDAVRLIREHSIDLVITEVIMPNGDGLEVILELKNRRPGARAIAISAGGRYLPAADCLRAAKGLGAHETLLKPVCQADLLAAVERVIPPAMATVA